MEYLKSSLAALPLVLVAVWTLLGVLGARLAPRPALQRWSVPSRLFHWIMAFCVLGTTSVMYYSQIFEKHAREDDAARDRYIELLKLHKSLGLVVLFLVLFRLAWNRYRARPPLPAGLSPSQRRVALGAHHLLYLLMFAIPLLGWLASMTYGGTTEFFGLFSLPIFLAKNQDAAVATRNGHIWLGWLLFAILLLHIGAALWHHFSRKDATLAQMLPWGRAA